MYAIRNETGQWLTYIQGVSGSYAFKSKVSGVAQIVTFPLRDEAETWMEGQQSLHGCKIIDLRRPGRPLTGNAKSPAERKRDQRARWQDLTRTPDGGFAALPLEILTDWMRRAVSAGWVELVDDCAAEARRRAIANDQG